MVPLGSGKGGSPSPRGLQGGRSRKGPGSQPAFLPRVVGIDDVERWIKTRCDVKGCWNTAITTCVDCDVKLCREHVCYGDGTLPYCRRCVDFDYDTTEFIEVGEWR